MFLCIKLSQVNSKLPKKGETAPFLVGWSSFSNPHVNEWVSVWFPCLLNNCPCQKTESAVERWVKWEDPIDISNTITR